MEVDVVDISRIKKQNKAIVVIIPAYNEAASIAKVLQEIPKDIVGEIIVVNNNSTDQTQDIAKACGATVLLEKRMGYGSACLCGIEYLKTKDQQPDIVVFIDADYSDYPQEIIQLVAPILLDDASLVVGSRTSGNLQKGALTPQQIWGNWLAIKLIKWMYGVIYTDLGPFRAIKYTDLIEMKMSDTSYGWTVEMQVKAAKYKMAITEIPVSYRRRIGQSKISGTLKGTILAGYKIITTIFKLK